MKRKKYVSLYYKWMETGELSRAGLCTSLDWPEELQLFVPKWKSPWSYWANEGHPNAKHLSIVFNPLRQNIVLFLAAMNNEL